MAALFLLSRSYKKFKSPATSRAFEKIQYSIYVLVVSVWFNYSAVNPNGIILTLRSYGFTWMLPPVIGMRPPLL